MPLPSPFFFISLLPFAYLVVSQYQGHILSLWRFTSGRSSTLSFPPTHLSAKDIIFVVLLLVLKSGLSLLGLGPPLLPSSSGSLKFALPALELSMPLAITDADIKQYAHAARLPLSKAAQPRTRDAGAATAGANAGDAERTRLQAPLLPAAISTPLMLLLLAHRTCPILALGAVNVRNRFEALVPEACTDLSDMRDLRATGCVVPEGRRTRRGVEVDVVVEVEGFWRRGAGGDGKIGGTPGGVEERTVLFRQVITVMQRLGQGVKPRFVEREKNGEAGRAGGMATVEHWGDITVPSHAPDAWAKVCCDYNPIHISTLAAKMFGFGGRIAHGNHVAATAFEMVRDELHVEKVGGDVLKNVFHGKEPWWAQVEFRRPMTLPLKAEVKGERLQHGRNEMVSWKVSQAGKVYIEGSIGFLP